MRATLSLGVSLVLACPLRAQAVQSAGATDWFGRGITSVDNHGTEVRLDLRVEAHGVLLRLVEGQPIMIVASGPFAAGSSLVRIPRFVSGEAAPFAEGRASPAADRDQNAERVGIQAACARQADPGASMGRPSTPVCVATERSMMPEGRASPAQRAPPREFLLLVLCDQPPDSTVLRRIGTIPGFDPATAAHDLAAYLVGRRSPMWAGYLARP